MGDDEHEVRDGGLGEHPRVDEHQSAGAHRGDRVLAGGLDADGVAQPGQVRQVGGDELERLAGPGEGLLLRRRRCGLWRRWVHGRVLGEPGA